MNKKQIVVIWIAVLLSGCGSMQDKSTQNDESNVRVSGDVTVSAAERGGGIYEK